MRCSTVNKLLLLSFVSAVLSCLCFWSATWASVSSVNPKAEIRYAAGMAARQKSDYPAAMAEFGKAIQLDPQFVDAHINFMDAAVILARGDSDAKSEWAIGQLKAMWEKTRSINPEWVKMYAAALLAGRGHAASKPGRSAIDEKYLAPVVDYTEVYYTKPSSKYLMFAVRAAAIAEHPLLAFLPATIGLEKYDPDSYSAALRNVAERFSGDRGGLPQSEVALTALSWLAEEARTSEERVALLERIRSAFWTMAGLMPQKSLQFQSAMRALFGIYLATDATKALQLAQEMATANPDNRAWTITRDLQSLIQQAQGWGEFDAPEYKELLAGSLEQARLQAGALQPKLTPSGGDPRARMAYQSMLQTVAQTPVEPLKSALYELGADMYPHLSREQVNAELWQTMSRGAKGFKSFDLPTYSGERRMSLADLRGKVVLVSFWNMGCGGCIQQFPFFQQLIRRYAKDNFVLVTINSVPDYRRKGIPSILEPRDLMQTGLMAEDKEWVKRTFPEPFIAEPYNVLLDAQGRVIREWFYTHTKKDTETVATWIDELMAYAAAEEKQGT